MKIAICTPSGNIGSKITERLLNMGGQELILLSRNPEKLAGAVSRGAEVIPGDLNDATYITRATAGVDAFFVLIPPRYETDDLVAYYSLIAENAAAAIKANGIPRVVFLSSIGAHLERGVGPVNGLHRAEKIIRQEAENLIILRPAFFMENYLMALPGISQAKSIFMPIDGKTTIPMVATEDIAEAAAGYLTDEFIGVHIKPLHGPKDYSFAEAAEIIGTSLSEKIIHVKAPREQTREALQNMGVSEHVAGLMLEMYDAMESGHMTDEFPRSPETTTRTTLDEFAEKFIAPAVRTGV